MENKKASSRKSHLPLYGVGPVYGAVIIAVTAAAVIAGHSALFEQGMIKGMRIPSAMTGDTADYFWAVSLAWCGIPCKSR